MKPSRGVIQHVLRSDMARRLPRNSTCISPVGSTVLDTRPNQMQSPVPLVQSIRRFASAQGKTVYRCSNCQRESLKWAGQCPQCKSWNTLEEVAVSAPPASQQIAKAERERQKWIGDDKDAQVASAAEQAKQAESQR